MMRAICTMLLAAGACLALSGTANAGFGIVSFGGAATDPTGARATQAGGHPDLRTKIEFPTDAENTTVDGSVRDVDVHLPPGLVGDPTGVPVCPYADFADQFVLCEAEAQVGVMRLRQPGLPAPFPYALYRVTPPLGAVARFASNIAGVIVPIDVKVRVGEDGEYRVVASSSDNSIAQATSGVDVTLWGVPADPAHDAQRVPRGAFGSVGSRPPEPSTSPLRPLTAAPTSCPGAPARTTVFARSWEEPGVWHSAWFDRDLDGFALVNEGCASLAFEPSMAIALTSSRPDAPTGLDVRLESPQNVADPDGLVRAHLDDVEVTLPEGLTVNPGSADGLLACDDGQLGLGSNDPAACPDGSKIGVATVRSPVLPEPVSGGVYLRSQASDDPESGELFRLALVVRDDDRGILVKLPGAVRADAETGRLAASFANNPQLPVDRVDLRLKSGPRAPLATPPACGQHSVRTSLTSWAGHQRQFSEPLAVDCEPGLGGFALSMTAGTVEPIAGGRSPFVLSIQKPDGDSPVNGLRMELPEGLLADLRGNLGRQVGSVQAFAGPGSNPLVLPGRVFLEGPYGDAPYSLRAVVPAKAGPFDLGEVVVRQKLYVDPTDAHVTVVSDPLPTIVKGVPVRLQRLDVSVDKPGFVVNPTSCKRKEIKATLGSANGETAAIVNRFRVGECAALGFSPKLAMTLSGRRQTRTGGHPRLKAVLTQPAKDQSTVARAAVTLPRSMALDPDNAQALCEFEDGTKVDLDKRCPKGSIVGRASAVTPLLERPLTGDVYFVKNVERNPRTGALIRKLPMLVVALRGEVSINLVGKSSVTKTGRLVTTFPRVPDAPVSRFALEIDGGGNGILVVTRTRRSRIDLCSSKQIARVQTDGHNGKRADFASRVKTPCKAKRARAQSRPLGPPSLSRPVR